MSDGPKCVPLREFIESGLLQEVNRQWFHPRGMALAVCVDDESGEHFDMHVMDGRDDPEGFIFVDPPDVEKAKNVYIHTMYRAPIRLEALGFIVQPAMETFDVIDGHLRCPLCLETSITEGYGRAGGPGVGSYVICDSCGWTEKSLDREMSRE